jgi:hypothetical protein
MCGSAATAATIELLFVKAFRIVGEAADKFFGRQSDPERWV